MAKRRHPKHALPPKAARELALAERVAGRASETPWYAFWYPRGRGRGSGWRYPKAYLGPFKNESQAQKATRKHYGYGDGAYKIRRMTASQFRLLWGAAPGEASAGY